MPFLLNNCAYDVRITSITYSVGGASSGGSLLIFGIRKIGRMEDGKGENFRFTHTSSQMDT